MIQIERSLDSRVAPPRWSTQKQHYASAAKSASRTTRLIASSCLAVWALHGTVAYAVGAGTSASVTATASLRGQRNAIDVQSNSQQFQVQSGPVSASGASVSNSYTFPFSGVPVINAFSSAYADVATGQLKVSANGTCAQTFGVLCYGEGTGHGIASIYDHFSLTSTTPGQSTALVKFFIDGLEQVPITIGDFNLVDWGLSFFDKSGQGFGAAFTSNVPSQPFQVSGNWSSPTTFYSVSPVTISGSRSYMVGFQGYLPLGDYDAVAVLDVLGRDGGSMDFSHTAQLSFVLSPGVVFSDATGTFSAVSTTSAAPESATWAMMIIGVGVIGCAMRRRSRSKGSGGSLASLT